MEYTEWIRSRPGEIRGGLEDICNFIQAGVVNHCDGTDQSSRPFLTHHLPAHTQGNLWKKPLNSLRDDLDVIAFNKEESKTKAKRVCERRETECITKSNKSTNKAS